MSSAVNHRKRSHRSQAKHHEASRRRMSRSIYGQEKIRNPGLLQRMKAMFRRTEAAGE